MNKSDDIKELATALAKAQGAMEAASKDKINPQFKSAYATLASVWDAIREPLSKNGLSVIQLPHTDEQGQTWVDTMLMHNSGQWISGSFKLKPTKDDPQGAGSAITYMKKYALAGMGVAPDDDDGNLASRHDPAPPPYVTAPARPAQAATIDPTLAASTWKNEAIKTLQGFKSLSDLTAWEARNKEAIARLKAVSRPMHETIVDALIEANQRLDA